MLQFQCAYASDSEEDKEEFIKVEAMPINVFDISVDEDFSMVYFMII